MMIRYQAFKKEGSRYSATPAFTCETPATVFATLSRMLIAKYVQRDRPNGIRRIEKRRCPYCDFFDEITFYVSDPSGSRSKIVFTVPFN